MKNFWREHCTH